MKNIIEKIVSDSSLHARWLNTLSLMENTGAQKIMTAEDAEDTTLIILKHAAEEARHAYFLKKSIQKLDVQGYDTYEPSQLVAPIISRQYLHRLDAMVSKYLKSNYKSDFKKLRYAAYLLVTYAIEIRAGELYPIYENILKKHQSKVSVRMIIIEEQGHLNEMIAQMKVFFEDWKKPANQVIEYEKKIHETWIKELEKEVLKVSETL